MILGPFLAHFKSGQPFRPILWIFQPSLVVYTSCISKHILFPFFVYFVYTWLRISHRNNLRSFSCILALLCSFFFHTPPVYHEYFLYTSVYQPCFFVILVHLGLIGGLDSLMHDYKGNESQNGLIRDNSCTLKVIKIST